MNHYAGPAYSLSVLLLRATSWVAEVDQEGEDSQSLKTTMVLWLPLFVRPLCEVHSHHSSIFKLNTCDAYRQQPSWPVSEFLPQCARILQAVRELFLKGRG